LISLYVVNELSFDKHHENWENIYRAGFYLKFGGKEADYAVAPPPLSIAMQEEIPDLILLDIMMPEMDGFEVCARLKSDTNTQDIPIIFISALGDTENKIKGFQAGGVDYITKPFDAAEVLVRVNTHLALQNMNKQMQLEISERKLIEKALHEAHDELELRVAQRTAELDKRTKNLAETNVALKVLLEKREDDKKELEEKIMFSLEKLIFPYLEKLDMRCDEESQQSLVRIIRSNLEELTSSFIAIQKDYLSNLTPAQIQIADLIKQGQTTKEIAALLNLSPSTIACHRQEIRKRLSLTNKKINLQAALSINKQ
jgi:DNA-binding response OmpR family regulator/DNA-binding CsgD family transcriptional regulator